MYFITSNPRTPDPIPYAYRMNIVFDFGNVLVEWNPARLIEEHYPPSARLTHAPHTLADALVNHQDWIDFDLGLIDAATLANRSAARLGLHAADTHAFIERIPHVLPLFDDALALMQELADGQHGARTGCSTCRTCPPRLPMCWRRAARGSLDSTMAFFPDA